MKVLLIAEACNPEWVSVPLVGWSHFRALSELPDVDVHLVTQVRNRDAILRAGKIQDDFTIINSEAIMRPAYKLATLLRGGAGKGWTTVSALSSLAYPYFEHLVWRTFRSRIQSGEFDIVHRLTPLSPTAPSLLAKKCSRTNVPFVLGPLNGGTPWPKEFDSARRKEKEWLSYVRGAYKFIPGYKNTRRYASSIIVASKATLDQVPKEYRHKCTYIAENGVDPLKFPPPSSKTPAKVPLRAAFIGRLVPYKGADMLIEASLDLVKQGLLEVDIYGDGPEMANLSKILSVKDVTSGICLHGNIPHAELHQRLTNANLLTFPSIREFGGGVVLEAMAVGLVPIVVGYGGPDELVDDACGYKVPIGNRESIVIAFRQILENICQNPQQLAIKSIASMARVANHFTWKAKAERVLEIYNSLVCSRN